MYALILLVSILTVSAAFFIILKILNRKCAYKKNTPSYTILFVKNNEDCIEGVLRRLILKINTCKSQSGKIIVIDMNSADNTLLIAKKLSQKYSFIYVPQYSKRNRTY